jgi:nucleotide-binding universal stress UspA family protein
MKKFIINKILIPTDFSETAELAVDHAVHMAKLSGAEIILLHVYETLLYTSGIDYSLMSVTAEYESAIQKSSEDKLEEQGQRIRNLSGVKVSTRLELGRAYSTVVDVAEELNVDIIIMGTHGVSGFQEFFIGSNAYRVVTSSPCPVLTVQTHATKLGFDNIVLPIDDSFASRQKVNYAIEMARKYNATIHVAGLMLDSDEDFVRKFKIKIEQTEEYLKNHNVKFTIKLLYGDNLADMAMDYGRDINADLIMIMTEQESDIKGIFMGPYAQQVVNHSKIPVISIRPEAEHFANQSFNPF